MFMGHLSGPKVHRISSICLEIYLLSLLSLLLLVLLLLLLLVVVVVVTFCPVGFKTNLSLLDTSFIFPRDRTSKWILNLFGPKGAAYKKKRGPPARAARRRARPTARKPQVVFAGMCCHCGAAAEGEVRPGEVRRESSVSCQGARVLGA